MHNPGKRKKKTNLASRQYSFEWGFWKEIYQKTWKQNKTKNQALNTAFYLIIITSIIDINT